MWWPHFLVACTVTVIYCNRDILTDDLNFAMVNSMAACSHKEPSLMEFYVKVRKLLKTAQIYSYRSDNLKRKVYFPQFSKKWTKLIILNKEDTQGSEICLFCWEDWGDFKLILRFTDLYKGAGYGDSRKCSL